MENTLLKIRDSAECLDANELYKTLQKKLVALENNSNRIGIGGSEAEALFRIKKSDPGIIYLTEENLSAADENAWAEIFSQAQAYFYTMSASAPYTKTDDRFLEAADRFDMPVTVLVTGYERLNDGAQKKEVENYIKGKLVRYKNTVWADNPAFLPLEQLSGEIDGMLATLLSRTDVQNHKENFTRFFLLQAIGQLTALCRKNIEKNTAQQEKIRQISRDKTTKLSDQESVWMELELRLQKKRRELEQRLRAELDKRKQDIIQDLEHDIETTQDVKIYWEKHLPYKLDKTMRLELQRLSGMINNSIIESLADLQQQISRNFKKKELPDIQISCDIENHPIDIAELKMSDNRKLRVVTKIGTAVTVLSALIIIPGNPVVGGTLVISALSAAGAEIFMNKKTDSSRSKAKNELPVLVDNLIVSYVSHISDKIKESYREILKNARNERDRWHEQNLKDISQEEQIALYNTVTDKWENCLEKLNEIANLI